MEVARALVLAFSAAIAGWWLATPLVSASERLLASVAPVDAAPVTREPGGGTLAPRLDRPWQWVLRAGLALCGALVAWRVGHAAHHTPQGIALMALALATLALVAVIDGATHLIFVETLAPLALAVAIAGIIGGRGVWPAMLAGALVAGALFLALYALGRLMYGTDALGWGDVELAALFGALLGWPGIVGALALGLLLMAIVTLILMALRRVTPETYLPIGAFLALGTLLALLHAPPPWLG